MHSSLPMGKQVFGYLQESSSAPSHVMVTWENKPHHSERPCLPSSSPPLYMLSMMSYGMEYPFG